MEKRFFPKLENLPRTLATAKGQYYPSREVIVRALKAAGKASAEAAKIVKGQ